MTLRASVLASAPKRGEEFPMLQNLMNVAVVVCGFTSKSHTGRHLAMHSALHLFKSLFKR